MGDAFWVDIQGLLQSVAGIEDESRSQEKILSRMRDNVSSLTDPAAFGVGDSDAGDSFHRMWTSLVRDFEVGVHGIAESTWATAEGVRRMAKIFQDAHEGAIDMATALGRVGDLLDGSTPGGGLGSPAPVGDLPGNEGGPAEGGGGSSHRRP
jgi:hypothetical protein